ncbi:putative decarboxylase [Reticulomyxa filosa]|uniref:Putative decarboxylase n=1 Tax=Reticulomyxa filosa TaxID=46433 RepID=X6NWR4_RETFI|nr:putative decarboxylase [Reticulomyxa filosa]|eukprot:ETO30760.1 putative decarboxylase [Reticulomyxa filosa]
MEMKSMLNTALNYVVKDLSVSTNGLVLPSSDKTNPTKGIGYKWIHENNESELITAFGVYNSFQEPVPEDGCGNFDQLLDKYFKSISHCSLNDNCPGYMAWIPSGAMYASCVADFISSCSNRFVSAFMNAPSLQAIEDVVIRWFLSMIGMSDLNNAGGILTGGGSMANFQAIHAARCHCYASVCFFSITFPRGRSFAKSDWECIRIPKKKENFLLFPFFFYLKKPEDILKLTVYVSEQSHYCIDQGIQMCGIPQSNVRYIPTHSDFTIKAEIMEQRIQEDLTQGLIPMMVVAVGGTTNTGSVDDIDKVCEIGDKYGVWKHVDGAYGGFFALTKRGSKLLKGIERADSVVLDPHKSFFLPYGTGCLLVRDKSTLLKANKATGAYMHEPYALDGIPNDLSDMGPELSRRFRGLGVWLPIKMYGIEVFRKELELKLDLTQYAVQQIAAIPYMRIMTQPKLTIFAFRLEYDQVNDETKDQMNKDLLDNINKRGNIVLSAIRSCAKSESNEKGKGVDVFCLRMVILSQRTQIEQLRQAIEDIKEATQEVMQAHC